MFVNVLYELSVTGCETDREDSNTDTSKSTSSSDEARNYIMPMQELETLRTRMERRDELREILIKRCRDAQKAAKQAIYALHRNDTKRTQRLLSDCERIVQNDLIPIVEEEPSLRHAGSLVAVLEEYTEAKMFDVWLRGSTDESKRQYSPSGYVLLPNEFTLPITTEEYLGGLCDLTGEVGRYAVKRGTARDSKAVSLCLQTSMNILYCLETLKKFPNGTSIGKKIEPLKRSVEKLERMLYELSLIQATGRPGMVADVPEEDTNDGKE